MEKETVPVNYYLDEHDRIHNFFKKEKMYGYRGELIDDRNQIFIDLKNGERKNRIIYDLYYERGRVTLSDIEQYFLYHVLNYDSNIKYTDSELRVIDNDVFQYSLKYVYPLIVEGKLKARVAKKIECEIMPDGVPRYTTVLWGEYGKGEGKEFIQDAERYYNKCENSNERREFRERSILFTLPENEWPY